MTFPSVTVCNENRIHCGNLNALLTKLYCQEGHFPSDWYEEENYNCHQYRGDAGAKNKVGKQVILTLIEVHSLTHCDLPMGYYYWDEHIVDRMVSNLSLKKVLIFTIFEIRSEKVSFFNSVSEASFFQNSNSVLFLFKKVGCIRPSDG